MTVTVKLFGTLRLDSGVREFSVHAAHIRDLYPLVLEEIRTVNPQSTVTEKDLKACLLAVNGKLASPRTALRDGDVVYFFPAVAGG